MNNRFAVFLAFFGLFFLFLSSFVNAIQVPSPIAGDFERTKGLDNETAETSRFEFGFLGANPLKENADFTISRFYLWNENQKVFDFENNLRFTLKSDVRFQLDSQTSPKSTIILRQLKGSLLSNSFVFNFGFLDLPWGETFGVFIADLVNPRDFTDPLFNDARWTKLAVFAVHPQIKLFSNIMFEGVWVPFPKMPILPRKTSFLNSFQIVPHSDFEWSSDFNQIGRQSELGARAGGIVAGYDFHVFAFKHWNRNFAFQLNTQSTGLAFPLVLESSKKLTDSYGLTLSKAFENLVLRADSVLTMGQPWTDTNFNNLLLIKQWQTIIGADFVWGQNLTLAGQAHWDQYELPSKTRQFFWLSARLQYHLNWHNGDWELFYFQGLGNKDRWIQSKLSFPVRDNFLMNIRIDKAWAAEQSNGDFVGYLATFENSPRVLYELSWLL